jgi:hypothetical protein
MNRSRLAAGLALAALAAGPAVPPAVASDHADPIRLDRLEGGITDLFAFPAKDFERRVRQPGKNGAPDALVPVGHADANRLVFILCVRRSLTAPPPYDGLDQFTYRIHIDLHSATERTFRDGDPNLARYGGTVEAPEEIGEDVKLEFVLNPDATFKEKSLSVREAGEWRKREEGGARAVRWHAGVHDDPFIFPQFFGTNVIAVVVSVPLDAFPGQQDFLFWATSHHRATQIDHVGRSQRTQLPRFDFLNDLHPRDHVRAINERRENPGLIDDFLRVRIAPAFAIRPFDVHPDVMYYTRRREPKYPNGRQLEDDVADLTCRQGDCQLFELSQSHPRSATFPGGRPSRNDKEFSDTFPYLAAPHPPGTPAVPPRLTERSRMLLVVIAVGGAAFVLLPWGLYLWTVRRLRRVTRQYLAARRPDPLPPAPAPLPAPGGPQP